MIEQIELRGKTRYLAHFDAKLHMPINVKMLAYYQDMGTVFSCPIPFRPEFKIDSVEIPEHMYESVRNYKSRQHLQWVMRTNRNFSRYPWLGRASSIFISKRHDPNPCTYNLDFFSEDSEHLWTGDPITHDYLRDHFGNYENCPYIVPPKPNSAGMKTLSGHIAPVMISSKDVAQIILLDCIKDYDLAEPRLKHVIDTLWANRYMVTNHVGHLLLPRTHPQSTQKR